MLCRPEQHGPPRSAATAPNPTPQHFPPPDITTGILGYPGQGLFPWLSYMSPNGQQMHTNAERPLELLGQAEQAQAPYKPQTQQEH